jgi:hypothetical protein
VVGKTLAVRGNAKCVQAIEVPTSAFHQETAAMPHHKSGCTGAIQPSCHHLELTRFRGRLTRVNEPSSPRISQFRVRRLVGLWFGAAIPAALLLAALLGYKYGEFSGAVALALAAVASCSAYFAYRQYRCPFCNREPEDDIPTYYPEACCRCGSKLR